MHDQQSEKNRVAFLGPLGTYSHQAALKAFGADLDPVCVPTIDDVFMETEAGKVCYGMVPVENSTEGAINVTLDCLIETDLLVVGETLVPIEHHLLLGKDQSPGDVTRIVSHNQSFAQCRKWLREHWSHVELKEVSSNAEAAKMVANEVGIAAIAGEMAAQLYGLKMATSCIQDRKDNTTRFLTLAKHSAAATTSTGNDKTSIVVHAENKPGALFRILESFEKHSISLTRIETRPASNQIWAYVFFIDFEGHVEDQAVDEVLRALTERTIAVKNLGSYGCAITDK